MTESKYSEMPWRDIQAQLTVARDAIMENRWDDAKELTDEVAPDVEWKRCANKHPHPRPDLRDYWWEDQDDGDDDYTPAETPMLERRQIRVQEWRRIDWLAWRSPLTTTSFDAMIRAAYPPEGVTQLAYSTSLADRLREAQSKRLEYLKAPLPTLVSDPFVASDKPDVDAIETRVRSWSNVVRPLQYGVLRLDGDDE